MANVITVIGERDRDDVDDYYVVTNNGWRRLGKTSRKRDLIQSSVDQFERQIRSGSVLVVAHLGTEQAASVSFDGTEFVIEPMNFDDVEY